MFLTIVDAWFDSYLAVDHGNFTRVIGSNFTRVIGSMESEFDFLLFLICNKGGENPCNRSLSFPGSIVTMLFMFSSHL